MDDAAPIIRLSRVIDSDYRSPVGGVRKLDCEWHCGGDAVEDRRGGVEQEIINSDATKDDAARRRRSETDGN